MTQVSRYGHMLKVTVKSMRMRVTARYRVDGSVLMPELARAKASLTRGYVRHFETEGQLVRAAAQLATYELDDRTFDRFVPLVGAVSPADIHQAAREFVRPAEASVIVVGDAATRLPPLEALGRPVVPTAPEF